MAQSSMEVICQVQTVVSDHHRYRRRLIGRICNSGVMETSSAYIKNIGLLYICELRWTHRYKN